METELREKKRNRKVDRSRDEEGGREKERVVTIEKTKRDWPNDFTQ